MKKVEIYPRGFKGVWIPAEIWLNENLNLMEKAILVEIDSLDRHREGGDYCYASNEHFAKFCGCGVTKVSTTISKLVELGYVEVVKTNGRKRWLKSNVNLCLSKNERQTFIFCESDVQIPKESNTSSNSSINTNKIEYNRCIPKRNSTLSFDYVEKQIDHVCNQDGRFNSECVKEIFRYYYLKYNRYMGKHHPRITNKNISEILDRIYETEYYDSFNLNDMRDMIDIHFNREYGQKIDYNINHFMTSGILDRLSEEVELQKDYF